MSIVARPFGWLFGRRASAAAADVPAASPVASHDLGSAVRSIGDQASGMGREAAEVRGLLDDSTKASSRSVAALEALAAEVQEITQAQTAIGDVSQAGLLAVDRARSAVEAIGAEVGAIVETLRGVSGAAGGITRIAVQTRLVAFNAAVEAKHAGDAGRGFSVVAEAVKDLAAQVESSSKEILRTVADLQTRIDGLAQEIRSEPGRPPTGAFHRALGDVQGGVADVTRAAGASRAICERLNRSMATIGGEMQQTGRVLGAAMQRSEGFLTVSEKLIEQVAECGIQTVDTPFIQAVMQAAQEVGQQLEAALDAGAITAADLFDEAYRPIAGTRPPQVLTRFVAVADRLFPAIQEPMLQLDPKVVFCIAADRNGYVATHNRKYCLPQRGDLAWDTANSRYRRIFDDRTGLASARNRRPFLLQTYRRDMGGGQFVVMKEAAAPITVHGRHWGGLRLAFGF